MAKKKGLSFYTKKKKVASSLFKDIFSVLIGMVIAIFAAGVTAYFFGMSVHVVGASMEPTLYNSQEILIDRFRYVLSSPKRGDVVVFLPNGNENVHYYVKRVVARPGDRIFIRNGVLYVNGIESPYVTKMIEESGVAENELIVGNSEFFCIGDDPDNSEDSRSANIGMVKEIEIVGKAWYKFSLNDEKMGLIQ